MHCEWAAQRLHMMARAAQMLKWFRQMISRGKCGIICNLHNGPHNQCLQDCDELITQLPRSIKHRVNGERLPISHFQQGDKQRCICPIGVAANHEVEWPLVWGWQQPIRCIVCGGQHAGEMNRGCLWVKGTDTCHNQRADRERIALSFIPWHLIGTVVLCECEDRRERHKQRVGAGPECQKEYAIMWYLSDGLC